MFEPFFGTKSLGRGLGLAAVEGVVRSLGGAIELESRLGSGTRITISLPTVGGTSARVDEMKDHRVELAQPSGAATILLVEDEDPLRQAVSKMLRKTGMSVIEAADGSVALDAIRAMQAIDVLILDVTIPGASSREVFAEARRLRPVAKESSRRSLFRRGAHRNVIWLPNRAVSSFIEVRIG